jgi:hypothetical protein
MPLSPPRSRRFSLQGSQNRVTSLVSQTADLTTKDNRFEGRLRSTNRPKCGHISLGDQLKSDLSGKTAPTARRRGRCCRWRFGKYFAYRDQN